jgi:hypothetical protein
MVYSRLDRVSSGVLFWFTILNTEHHLCTEKHIQRVGMHLSTAWRSRYVAKVTVHRDIHRDQPWYTNEFNSFKP